MGRRAHVDHQVSGTRAVECGGESNEWQSTSRLADGVGFDVGTFHDEERFKTSFSGIHG
jgi:hypothetical protein